MFSGGLEAARLFIGVGSDTDGAEKGLDRVNNKIGGFIGGAGRVATAATVAGGAVVTAFGVKAVMAGSDMQETMSKTDNVFKTSAASVHEWAKGASRDFGQSRTEALNAASTFGNLFVQLGTGAGESAKLSMSMTELASDFASFHNAAPTDVVDAMTAAFRGEYDAVQRFVPTINAAAVEQAALAMTGKAATKELTAQEKALATQKLMMEGAGDATGDFDRTSQGLANRLRIAKAEAMDFAANVGVKLIPFVLKAWDVLEGLGGTLARTITPYIKTAVLGVKAFVAAFREGDVTSDGFVGKMEQLGVAFRKVVDAVSPVVQKIKDFVAENPKPFIIGIAVAVGTLLTSALVGATVALVAFLAPIVAIPLAIAAVVAGFVLAYQKIEWFRNIVDTTFAFVRDVVMPIVAEFAGFIIEQLGNAIAWVKEMWPQISEAIGHVMNVVSGIIESVVGFIMKLWKVFGDDILTVVSGAFNMVKSVVETVINTIAGVIKLVLAVINGDWGKAWDAMKQIVVGIWDGIKGVIGGALEVIKGVIGGAYDGFKTAITTAWNGAWEFVTGLPGKMLQAGKDMIQGFIDGIKAMASKIISAIKETITDKLPSFVKDALGISSPSKVFIDIGNNVGMGMVVGIRQAEKAAVAAAGHMTDAVSGVVSGVSLDAGYGGTLAPTGTDGAGIHVEIYVDATGADDPQAVGDAVGAAVDEKLGQILMMRRQGVR